MPIVTVQMWEGRTIAQKKQICADITTSFTKHGVPVDAVVVIFQEGAKCNFAHAGVLDSEGRPDHK